MAVIARVSTALAVFGVALAIFAASDAPFRRYLETIPIYFSSVPDVKMNINLEYSNLAGEEVFQKLIKIRELDDVTKISEDPFTPAIVRNMLPNCLDVINQHPSDEVVTLFDVVPEHNGNVWRAGFTYTMEAQEVEVSGLLNQSITFTDKYASFGTFLTPEQFNAVAPDFVKRKRIARDTNFLANFSNSAISTPIHAAGLINSWSLQCTGEKRWLIFPAPLANIAAHTVVSPAVIPLHANEKILFESDFPVYAASVRDGDMLYFPPNWMHLVQTRPGFNVMFNFREVAIPAGFKLNPILTLSTLIVRYLDSLIGKRSMEQFRPDIFRNNLDESMYKTIEEKLKENDEYNRESSLLKDLFERIPKLANSQS